jgi:hypothetical protein
MTSTTSTRTIEELRKLFAQYGLVQELVSDNGPQFTSSEFKTFLERNGVKHTLVPPYHPASNGQAERYVQTVKNSLKKHFLEGKSDMSVNQHLCSFLLAYRVTPHSLTGKSPAELFMKRQLRTRFTLLKPSLKARVEQKQDKQKEDHDSGLTLREFAVNERVRVKSCRGPNEIRYVPGVVVKRLGPVRYLVRVGSRLRYTHADHLRKTGESDDSIPHPEQSQMPNSFCAIPDQMPSSSPGELPKVIGHNVPMSLAASGNHTVESESSSSKSNPSKDHSVVPLIPSANPTARAKSHQATPSKIVPESTRRYPIRDRNPPDKYKDFVMKP